jgi:hypothetical protein
VHIFLVFQMGIIFNFNDMKKMQPVAEITFGSLDFVTDQLGNWYLQEHELAMQEEEQSPSICMFLARLENAMEVGPIGVGTPHGPLRPRGLRRVQLGVRPRQGPHVSWQIHIGFPIWI